MLHGKGFGVDDEVKKASLFWFIMGIAYANKHGLGNGSFYDTEEIIENARGQIWSNSKTGDVSIGWNRK